MEEESNIISKTENENIPLTNKRICKYYKDKPKASSNTKIIFISLALILILTITLCYLYFTKDNREDPDNNDYKFPVYEKNKAKKEDIESLKDLREKNKDLDNDEDNEEGKDANEPLNEKKGGKLFDDEDNADNKNDQEEPMLQRNKISEIKKDQVTEKEVINNDKRKDLKPNEKKNIFGDEDNNEDGGKSENKNQTTKVFDEKEEGNNEEQEPVIQEKQLNKTRIENSDVNNHEFKHDKEDEDNMDNDDDDDNDDKHKKEEKSKDINDKMIRRLKNLN